MRYLTLTIFLVLILPCAVFGQTDNQDENSDEAGEVELRPVNLVNGDYGFGMALPDGYLPFDFMDEDNNVWTLNIMGEMEQPSAILNVEPLPDDVVDVAGYWQAMKDRDQYMENNITYEKVDSVAGVGAIQARIERIESGNYLLTITWVFVHDDYGFVLSAYPPVGGDNNLARDLAMDLIEQFRWMTPEEIETTEVEEPNPDMGGQSF